jgi:multicomponent Na+:H+ antiporter subunit B
MWLLALGMIGVGVCYAFAALDLPSFGTTFHPYRDMAIPAAVAHQTANAVTSIVFDQRGLDTLVEEIILFGSVVGAVALLRPAREEQEHPPSPMGRVLEPTRMLGYAMLPTTLVVGVDVVVHGHLTPGGGFQGGVILATALHLLYVAGSYQALDRLRTVELFEHGEALGAAGFAVLGIAGIITSAAVLTNMLSHGTLGQLFSAGTVPLLNALVGLEVASSVIVLLARFFDQAMLLGPRQESLSPPQPGALS